MKDIFEELDNMSDDELLEEMNSILEEVKENETVTDFDAPDFLHDSIFSEIREIEEREAREKLSAEDKRLLEYGRRYKRQLKFRKYWILAAALVLMFAMGITSVGGPQRFFNRVVDKISGREQEMVDSENGVVVTDDWDEEKAYDMIEEKYGFRPVKLDYLPEGVVFEGVEINEEVQECFLVYAKENKLIVQLVVRTNYNDSSFGVDIEDRLVQKYEKQVEDATFKVTKYSVKENGETRWKVSFEHNNIYYLLVVHNMDQSQLEEILDNIIFM